jgi:hypothetical protein
LVKQFPRVFFEVFMPKADKVIPLLIDKREMEEAEIRLAAADEKSLAYVDRVPENASVAVIRNAQDLDRLGAAFPMRGSVGDKSMEQWTMREFKPLHNPDWRCGKCVYGVNLDGDDDVRTKWCTDCAEERRMYRDEDKGWMCFEVPSVSCLTKEWDCAE